MDEQRLIQYVQLIQQLLSCPSGKESEIFEAHRELWDEGLGMKLQAVAEQLQEKGQEDKARVLLSLTEQLAEALGGSKNTGQDYLSFLMEVLQTVSDSRGNPQVVYPLLVKNVDKLSDEFRRTLHNWGTERLQTAAPEEARSIGADIGNFVNLIQQFPLGSRASNLEIAITGYKLLTIAFPRESQAEMWAMTQNNLGAAYRNRINGSRAENLERAIEYYQAALTVRTREDFPEDWARTHNNLAVAYSTRINGSRAENLERAIEYYQAALTVRTREDFPEDWAMTHNNLAAAYRNRINGSRAENLEKAIQYYQAALTVYKLEDFPEYWAGTQNNLAIAYSDRINGSRAENLERAIAFYDAALTVRTLEDFPEQWAETQNNLGEAYRNRINGLRAENLERAIECYQAALTVRTRADFPEQWAETQNNLAVAYSTRINGSRAENLEQAIEYFQAALTVYKLEDFPEDWARTQHNLAIAYRNRIKGSRAENLERAIESYEAALTVYKFEDFPEHWATTQNNLATAYSDRINGSRAENLERAIESYEAALTVYKFEDFPEKWAGIQNDLANAYKDRINGSRVENLERVLKFYKNALTIRTREAFPQDYIATLWNLGLLYKEAKQWQKAYDTYEPAIETVELLRGEESTDDNRQKLAEQWNRLYLGMVEVCIALELYAEAVEYAERSKGQNLIELLSVKDLYPQGEIPPEVRQELQSLKDRIYAEDQRLKQAPEKNYDLIAQLRDQHAALYPYTPLKFPQIQELASASTALVEWYILTDRFCTFLVTGGIQLHQSTPQDQEQLANWAVEYLTDYYNDREAWQNSLETKLANLAQILHIDAILQTLPQNTQQLILVPHRYLHLFPLHALPVSPQTWQHFHPHNQNIPPHPLVLDCFDEGVRYTPSCQLLHKVQQQPQRPFQSLFAVQTPTEDLHDADYGVTDAIKQQFDNPIIINKHRATRANLLAAQQLPDTNCLFFYCHGYFDANSPLNSGLQLANGNLTLSDIIAHLDLRNCRLVTLSACETGQTRLDSTDEYIGLPSGFMLAGSQNIIGSLWSVSALATSLLMTKFYTELQKSPNIALALNQSQKWLRNVTVKELQEWLPDSPLEDEWQEKLTNTLEEWGKFIGASHQPFNSPAYWAAFCAIGKGA